MFLGNFLAVAFSATTGLRCELNINDRQQVWHISANIEQYVFTARSKAEKPITHQTAMLEVQYGYSPIAYRFLSSASPEAVPVRLWTFSGPFKIWVKVTSSSMASWR